MKEVFILSCSTNLGSCCTDKALSGFFSATNNIIQLIQIVVPILLIVAIIIDMIKLLQDPDNKKIPASIKNKLIAAVIVFMIPVLVNTALNLVSNSGSNSYQILSCLQESKNVKLSGNTTYIDPNSTEGKDNKRSTIPGANAYEKGKKKKSSSTGGSSSSSVPAGQKITVGEAQIGDGGVKLRENIYHKHSAINKKLNNMDVVNYALSWKGKMSYKHGSTGELRIGGTCDCSHFIYKVFQHFNAVEGDWIYCSVWGSGNVAGTTLYSDPSKLVPGDVVYKYYSKYAQHVEIYLGNNRSVGCNGGKGVNEGGNVSKNFDTFIHINAYD